LCRVRLPEVYRKAFKETHSAWHAMSNVTGSSTLFKE
jgi:hypothetical protein